MKRTTPTNKLFSNNDPDGLRISEFIRNNLKDLKNIRWSDYTSGYDPYDLIIERFGLNFDFIENHNLTWIDNLVTGSGNILAREVDGKIIPGLITKGKNAGKPHQNFFMDYMQDYIHKYGVRKCEANAIVTMPEEARNLVENSIINYLGDNSLNRFEEKREMIREEFNNFLSETGLDESMNKALEIIRNR